MWCQSHSANSLHQFPPFSPSQSLAMAPKPNFSAVFSESKRIVKGNPRHFLVLTIIFFLPLSSSILLYPTLFQPLNHFYSNVSHIHSQHQPINPTSLFFYLLYSLFALVFSFCAVISITYSVFHGFYGQPLNLLSAIKSIFTSFFPLLATTIVLKVIFFFISLLFGLLLFLFILGIDLVGITISYSSPYFLGFSATLLVIALLFVVTYLQVTWTLVPVIVVVESNWGLEPLRRSATLMKGMKGVAVSSLFFFGFFEGIFLWSTSILTSGSNGITFEWDFVVHQLLPLAVNSIFVMVLMLYSTAFNTVLYIYCKAIHDEVEEEFEKDYVSLPFDDEKIPHVV